MALIAVDWYKYLFVRVKEVDFYLTEIHYPESEKHFASKKKMLA